MTSILIPGLRIQDVQLIKEIGFGGQARVWQVKELAPPHRDDLAAKLIVIPFEDRSEPDNVKKIKKIQEHELANWAKIRSSHYIVPFFVPVNDVIEKEGSQYEVIGVTMPLADGVLAADLIGDSSLVKLENKKETKQFLLNIAQGLKAAHDVNISHGDIKPANVLLFREGQEIVPKLMDFGLSLSTQLSINEGLGTPEYMAPEAFLRGVSQSIEILKAADVYSLGVLFYHVIYGNLPFEERWDTEKERFEKYAEAHAQKPIPQPKAARPCDADLKQIVTLMMSKDIGKRITLNDVITRLQAGLYVLTQNGGRLQIPEILRPGIYRWNPSVHTILKNQLLYYLFKASSPSTDVEWVQNNLRDQGFHGYSIYRVLGGYDYLLRLWIKPHYEDRIDRIMEHFKDVRATRNLRFKVRVIKLFKNSRPVSYSDREKMLAAIADCADSTNENNEYEALKTAGFISSQLPATGTQKVRLFVTVLSPKQVPDKIFDMFLSKAKDEMCDIKPCPSEVSVYYGTGDFRGLIKFRLNHFHDYAPISDRLQKFATETRVAADLGFQTYVELDSKGYIECDDGSIIREVSEYEAEH
ncbi:serine/threonine protein kinase [Candidatus Peregrinibacteria bacterium]|nr:serine/threonine protein kinase [Candidatus Peregrinibacteria bacterium]